MNPSIFRTCLRSLFCLLISFLGQHMQAQILLEDFQGGVLPTGWAVFDGDGQTPNASVAQFTSAWIVADDFDISGEKVAMSTSWYINPTGPSNDWLLTPAIPLTNNNELRWQAEAQDPDYPDGYEVRLSPSAQFPATVGNYATLLFSIGSENAAVRTTRSVNLQNLGFSNQNVNVAFRNNSFDMFILMVDNIEVRVALNLDATVTATAQEYTILPFSQAASIPIEATVTNQGVTIGNGTSLKVNVYDGNFNLVSTATSAAQNLPPGGSALFSVPGFSPTVPDFYTFELVSQLTGDGDPTNDTLYYGILVDDSTMARDDGNVTNILGIGAGNGGIMGQIFELNTPARLSSVSYFHQPWIGQTYVADVYNWVNGRPGSVIASTQPFFATSDTGVYITSLLDGGSIVLPADTFYVGVREPDSTLRLGICPSIFLPGVTWISWPTNPNGWSNNEDFGFFAVYVVRPNFNECAGFTANAIPVNTPCGQSQGSASLGLSLGTAPFSYLWSNGATTSSITGLASGVYDVTVTDAIGCEVVTSAIINDINAPVLSCIPTPVTCPGGSDGTALVNASGGTNPYTYQWSNGGTSANITGLSAGVYSVTVIDGGGCQSFASTTISEPSVIMTGITATDETCLGCADGTASVVASGGTPPYTYLWSNGATTANISNLAPGTYNVTVTDTHGCQVFDLATVNSTVGLAAATKLQVQLSPNPNDGQFRLDVLADFPDALTVTLYDLLGKPVWTDSRSSCATYSHEFPAGMLPAGQYLVEVKTAQMRSIRRLVVQ